MRAPSRLSITQAYDALDRRGSRAATHEGPRAYLETKTILLDAPPARAS